MAHSAKICGDLRNGVGHLDGACISAISGTEATATALDCLFRLLVGWLRVGLRLLVVERVVGGVGC
jgi:hypothetical protein